MKWILCLLLTSGFAFAQNNNVNTNVNNNGNGMVNIKPITINNNDDLGECYEDCRDELLSYLDGDESDDIAFVDAKCRKYCNLPRKRQKPGCDNDLCIKVNNKNTNENENKNSIYQVW